MKEKHLKSLLQELKPFDKPCWKLEQYCTPIELAATICHNIGDDLDDKLVADLGCGTGILTFATALCGAVSVGFEIDDGALAVAQQNLEVICSRCQWQPVVDFVNCDVLAPTFGRHWQAVFDTVVLNPPFGTSNNCGTDVAFLRVGFQLARRSVYSFHKTSTRKFILKELAKLDCSAKVIGQMAFELPRSFHCHKRSSVFIDVDLVQVIKT